MGTKSYKVPLDSRLGKPTVDPVRFNSRTDELTRTQQLLNDTREAFNLGVDYLTGWLLKMHRGAGLCREKKDGIWREWQELSTLAILNDARKRHAATPDSFALLENRELLDVFANATKSEAKAVELAECCRRIAKELCPPSEDSTGAQMPRDSLYLLLDPHSRALGLREGPTNLKWRLWALAAESTDAEDWKAKLTSRTEMLDPPSLKQNSKTKNNGPRLKKPIAAVVRKVLAQDGDWQAQCRHFFNELDRPEWLRNQVLAECTLTATSHEQLVGLLRQAPEFVGEKGEKHISRIEKVAEKKQNAPWDERQSEIINSATREVCDYKRLYTEGCLPIPTFGSYHDDTSVTLGPVVLTNVGSEWKLAMWNMAGQRVRSHLGWARRRSNERLVWELVTTLFERGGWIRIKRNGRTIRRNELLPRDIQLEIQPTDKQSDFEHRPGYSEREWIQVLRQYESQEMPKQLEGIAFGTAGDLRLRKRTAKGWTKVREKWLGIIDKSKRAGESPPSAHELINALNEMRARKSREFGDQRFFVWLAAKERRWLWDASEQSNDNDCGRDDRDCVAAFIGHNEHLSDKPESITFTRSHAVKHPVWPYFGENSAVEYWLSKEECSKGTSRLVLIFKQLLCRERDDSFTAVDNVKVALRGYEDFEKSFSLPEGLEKISAKQELVFRDDLLGGMTRAGTLSGMKLTWDRDELEAANRKRDCKNTSPRIYANFSCNAGDAALPEWLTHGVGYLDNKNTRDGVVGLFKLDGGIRYKGSIKKTESENEGEQGVMLPPGTWKWPKQAIDNAFGVRGSDLGYRTASAGTCWRLSLTLPAGKVAWQVGFCDDQPVYAVYERNATVSLPGDGESLPADERALRERFYFLRTRLNLNNALLRIVRLLEVESVSCRTKAGDRMRKRSDGTTKCVGVRWKTESKTLAPDEINQNCRKAAEQLVRWAATDAMTESLAAIGHNGSLWEWFAEHDIVLKPLCDKVPSTTVPTEKEARENNLDRDSLKAASELETDIFADFVHRLRLPLANALCNGHDAEKRKRPKSGLWADFDAALIRELSYSTNATGARTLFENGLFRLLRKPPTTKHNDRKDEVNNLPHGRTHRGGLSMARLNFLDDVKSFVRRWSCRPRWPGDVRRVPEDAKFDRCDTEHLDHLREHRAKLIAHSDVAQALGFEQDLRRGLWRYRDATSDKLFWHRPERGHFYRSEGNCLVQCPAPNGVSENEAAYPLAAFAPVHVLVYEDLTRYKMSSDRPKNENAGLARWSHRRILAFAQHIGSLFGLPVATVDARFSSRYCSQCGAPGCRAVRFDPEWLSQRWIKTILESNDIRDAAMKSVATRVRNEIERSPHSLDREDDRPWVLRDGGTHFVCANPNCTVHSSPSNADENASGTIGLRFLRGIDGFRVTINANGKVTKSIGYVPRDMVLTAVNDENSSRGESYWQNVPAGSSSITSSRKHSNSRNNSTQESAGDDEDESRDAQTLFCDPSGGFLSRDRWFASKVYWAAVARSCAAGIIAVNASRFGSDEDD